MVDSEPGKPESMSDWLGLIEPLDAEGTTRRLRVALEGLDAEAVAGLCGEAANHLPDATFGARHDGVGLYPTGWVLVAALAERAAELDVERFTLLSLKGEGAFWDSFRPKMVQHYAARDFQAAAGAAFSAPHSKSSRHWIWNALATANTGRSFPSTMEALGEVFAEHATPAERERGLEKTLGEGALAFIGRLHPAEMRAWLTEHEARLGGPSMDPEDKHLFSMTRHLLDRMAPPVSAVSDEAPPPPRSEPESKAGSPAHEDLARWIDRDPRAAAQWWQSQPPEERSSKETLDLARALANVDPAAVPRLLEAMDPDSRKEAVLGAGPQLGRLDPGAAAAAILTLENSEDRVTGLRAITETVAARGASEGLVWVRSLPTELHPQAVGGLIDSLAMQEPALAAEAVSAWAETGGTVLPTAVEALAREWATGAPAAAAAWAESLPPGRYQDHALRAAAVTWAGHDAEAARAWIDMWPASQVKYDCEQLIPAP